MTPSRTEEAEAALRSAGFPKIRINDHGDVARLAVPEADLARLGEPGIREIVVGAVRGAGYRFVALDLDGE
jgi:uncharacterized protein